jgi:hypothetical protein
MTNERKLCFDLLTKERIWHEPAGGGIDPFGNLPFLLDYRAQSMLAYCESDISVPVPPLSTVTSASCKIHIF